jgi:hypothetical protein
MPGPASRWFHLLPRWAHRTEVVSNHVAQLVAPFLLFLPQPVAGIGAAVMIITQGYLMISGNYAWLNLLTLVLGFAAIPDSWFSALGVSVGSAADPPGWFAWSVIGLTAGLVALSYWPVRNLLSGRQRMNASFNAYHLVNTYGAFGSVTRSRRELILEATSAVDPTEADWFQYEFKGKPGDPRRIPRQYAPYHLRLDWLMWFVPLSAAYGRGWLDTLVTRLLEEDEQVLALLAGAPDETPRWIRGRLVDYRFANRAEKRATGMTWITGAGRTLFGPTNLDGRRP